MRLIGYLPDEKDARKFHDALCGEGVSSEIEADKEAWAVWVHSEDQLDQAKELLGEFLKNRDDARFSTSARRARQIRKEAERDEERARERIVDRSRLFRNLGGYSVGWLTIVLVGLCLGIFWLTGFGENREWVRTLQIAEPYRPGLAAELRSGQVWRVLTPIFLHFGWWHLLFNMLCLFDLGGMIEGRQGTGRLAVLVVLIGVGSNLGQYLWSGPAFGGMSGVIYGLFGYIWMRAKHDPASGLFLHPTTVTIMLAWFFLCLTGVLELGMGVRIANMTHAVGLGMGMAWGYVSSRTGWFRR